MSECPRCGLLLQPGVAFFDGPNGPSAPAPSAAAQTSEGIERKSISCLPMDLERVARAEAVDGWSLNDTTVDPEVSGNILAHFRRPFRSRKAAAPTELPVAKPVSEATKQAPAAKPNRKAARRPDFGPDPRPVPENVRSMLLVLLVIGLIVILADNFGLIGVILGLVFVPGLIRTLVGRGPRRGRRR